MTNRSSAKQHGYATINERRPKSNPSKKRNKALASARRTALREQGLNC